MHDQGDLELIRQFAEQGSDPAFAALVRRHIDLVYGAALRQVRNSHVAEDVTQAVFLILARKAGAIKPPCVLAGWLLNTTHYASRNAMKLAQRRLLHERSAAEQRTRDMRTDENSSADSISPAEPGTLAGELDEAMARLSASARAAVVLRFFGNKNFKEVGAELGLSEEAAKQRVFRGLDKLRRLLLRGGVAISADRLGAALPLLAIQKAPAALTSSAIGAAQGAIAAAAPGLIAKGALTLMAWSNLKAAAVGLMVLTAIGGTGVAIGYYVTRDRDVVAAGTLSGPPGALQSTVLSRNTRAARNDRSTDGLETRTQTQGTVHIQSERWPQLKASADAAYRTVPPPSAEDAGTTAKFSIVDGDLPPGHPDPMHCINDGKVPHERDSPEENFRFAIGNREGRLKADLGQSIAISQVNTYSWHTDSRAPQVYELYGSNGASATFYPSPKRETDPATCGWKLLASVDTRPEDGPPGGRYAVSVSDKSGSLGTFRYLLFVMHSTDLHDGGSLTFYSEIDIVQKK